MTDVIDDAEPLLPPQVEAYLDAELVSLLAAMWRTENVADGDRDYHYTWELINRTVLSECDADNIVAAVEYYLPQRLEAYGFRNIFINSVMGDVGVIFTLHWARALTNSRQAV